MKRTLFLSFIYILGLFFPPTTFAQQTPVKVMPLGDSITFGVGDQVNGGAGYRYGLYYEMTNDGIAFDFVGSVASGNIPDRNNEGHSGWTIGGIKGSVNSWLANYKPDIIILLIGTNNLKSTGANPQTTSVELENLLDQIQTQKPDVKILVSSIPPITKAMGSTRIFSPLNDANVKPYNALIPGIVSKKQQQGKKVYFIDLYNVFKESSLKQDFNDDLHPSGIGYHNMAVEILPHLEQLIRNGVLPTMTVAPTAAPTSTIPTSTPHPPTPTNTITYTTATPSYLRSDFGGLTGGGKDGKIDIQDYNILAGEFYKVLPTYKANIIDTGLSARKVDVQDYNTFVSDFLAYLAR